MPLPAFARSRHVDAPHATELFRMYHSAAPKSPIILIPTRLAAARLPRKPLADIAGSPMILHVWRHAVAAEVGPVVVASGDSEIAVVIAREGGRAVLTDPALPTGSDRIHAAITALDPERHHDAVINVQGDMPMLDPAGSSGKGRPERETKASRGSSRRKSAPYWIPAGRTVGTSFRLWMAARIFPAKRASSSSRVKRPMTGPEVWGSLTSLAETLSPSVLTTSSFTS